jgi:hypothetical protein
LKNAKKPEKNLVFFEKVMHRVMHRPVHNSKIWKSYAQVMHRLCTGYAQVMHRLCTGYAQVMHRLCTGYAQVMHRLCTEADLNFQKGLNLWFFLA